MEKEYTIQELADLFEINPEAVHDHLVENKIPFIKKFFIKGKHI